MSGVTIGIDIGTSSVKAVGMDSSGEVLTKFKLSNNLISRHPKMLEHNAKESWHAGALKAWESTTSQLAALEIKKSDLSGVCVTSMVPTLTAVNQNYEPISPGLIYGDQRGSSSTSYDGEFLNFLHWTAEKFPEAAGYWPAQSVANAALTKTGAMDTLTALTTGPLFANGGWDEELCEQLQISPDQLPRLAEPSEQIGDVEGVPVSAGSIDAFCEMLVTEAQDVGDVLIMCGSTLVCWTIMENEPAEPNGLWVLPHYLENKLLVGGPSNAGGLFIDKTRQLFGDPPAERREFEDPDNIPVWLPYLRGERVPLDDPDLNASVFGIDATHTSAHLLRGAYEASAFVVKRHIELAQEPPKRILATGGGVQSHAWMQAIADATNLPVGLAAVPEGAALGAACIARELGSQNMDPAQFVGRNQTKEFVEPDQAWAEATQARYQRFLELHSK